MDDEKRRLIERYLSAYNAFDIDGMLAVLHEDIEFSNVRRGERNAHARGKWQFRGLAEHARTLFNERELTVHRCRAEENRATVEIRFRGVLAFDLPNGMQRGEGLEFEGRSEFVFQDGLIRRIIDIS